MNTTPAHTSDSFFDLTKSQLLIWMGQKLQPASPMYNMAIAFELNGEIDYAVFKKAFQHLVDQCDAMRTVFIEVDGVPQQKISADFSYETVLLDFSQENDKSEKWNQWKNRHSQKVFDMSSCLFESVLIKMDKAKYIWFFNQHHLIIDAWAVTLQYNALATLYQRLQKGDTNMQLDIPLFEHYIKTAAAPPPKNASDYWETKASQLPDPPDFYGRNNRQMESRSIRHSIKLGTERSQNLRDLTSETDLRSWTQHLSLFTIFSSLLFSFMHRISGQQKLSFGAPAHNRSTTAYKETPGLFIELFPMMAEMSSAETFSSLVQKVRDEAHQFLRYAQANTSTPELNRSFNAVLNYINASFTDFNDIPMQSEWVHSEHADPGHHLRLQVHDFDASGDIELCFDLNVAVFDEQQRREIPQQFLQLLDAFISDRFQPIGQVPLKGNSDAVIVAPSDNFEFDTAKTLIDLWEDEISNKTLTDIAIRYDDKILSYPELDQHVNQLAHYLLQNDVAPNDRVAILLQRSPEFVISVLAVLKVGATFVPIPVNYPSGRILGIIEDAQPKVILSNSVIAARLPISFKNLIALDKEASFIQQQVITGVNRKTHPDDLAYLMYTSGSTGKPKGVMISHQSLSHYILWARQRYAADFRPVMPLFTSLGFDLTITSLFLPLMAGGTLVTFQETMEGPDLALFEVLENQRINIIKLTPAHLSMLGRKRYTHIKSIIVGGENFKTDLADAVQNSFGDGAAIYNEYGPTEATVGCVVHQYDAKKDNNKTAVPIGLPIANTSLYILDEFQNPVPDGVTGELFIGGIGLAKGYWNQVELTAQSFINNTFTKKGRLYRSGDLVRKHADGYIEYLGRKDLQVKIRGRRVELAEIESVLQQHPKVTQAVVELRAERGPKLTADVHNCTRCGLPSNYPKSTFNEEGVCNLCQDFSSYQEKVKKYFKTEADLQALFDSVPADQKGAYDCIALLSGGKDSTYVLAQLVEMGLRPLAFTLDNGYISEGAKANINRVVNDLGVDHVYGQTEAMNAIFVDSLQRHCNVCDGCFKTIYTLSVQLALEKKIPFIVTGLSRGQFFETRLTEELFRQEEVDIDQIDATILNARKAYHQVDDAVKQLLDTSMFDKEDLFEKIQFVDFYRYSDVSLEDMLSYLDKRLSWVRPSDTGRSTNCLINQAGIYVHKKERGYSNYAFPYSWDVRIGHKTRDASLDEINEAIDEQEVQKILNDIGYTKAKAADKTNEQLVAYYLGDPEATEAELRNYLLARFPDYMVPVQFIHLDEMPMTVNGKIDREALPEPDRIRPLLQMEYVAPQTEFEELIRDIWSEVLRIDQIGIYDNFIEIGGHSLAGIRIVSRMNENLELELPANIIFQKPTIAALALHVEELITILLQQMETDPSGE